MASWVVGIYAWSTVWNFFDLTWSQWPQSERVPYISEKLDFLWSIPQKITSIGYFGASDGQTIRIRKFFWENWGLEAVEASEVAEAAEVNEAAEVLKVQKITTEDFRVIQAFEIRFILMFWKKVFGVESWNIILDFSTFSVGGCWGQPMSFFFKLVDETQMYKPPEATRHYK